jgi:hypothetical protein
MASRTHLAGTIVRPKPIRTERADTLDSEGHVRKTMTALAHRLSMTRHKKRFGRMSQRWLEEYVAGAHKHDG